MPKLSLKIVQITKNLKPQQIFRKYVLVQRFRAILSMIVVFSILIAHEIQNDKFFMQEDIIKLSNSLIIDRESQIQDSQEVYLDNKRYKVYNYMYILQITFGICSSILYMLAKYLQYIQYKIIKIRTKLDSPFSGLNMYRSILYCILLNIQYRYTYGKLDNIKIQNLAWLNGPIYQYYSNIVDLVFFVNFSIHFFTIIYILIITSFVAKPCCLRKINRVQIRFMFQLKYLFTEKLLFIVAISFILIWIYFCILIKIPEDNLHKRLYEEYQITYNQDLKNMAFDKSFYYFKNIIWFNFLTMTNIGYGDIYPQSLLGRLFTCILAIFAYIISSFLIVAAKQFFVQNPLQQQSYQIFEQVEHQIKIRKKAAIFICFKLRIILDETKKKKLIQQHFQKFGVQRRQLSIEQELKRQDIILNLKQQQQQTVISKKYKYVDSMSKKVQSDKILYKDRKIKTNTQKIDPINIDDNYTVNQNLQKAMQNLNNKKSLSNEHSQNYKFIRSDQLTYKVNQNTYIRQNIKIIDFIFNNNILAQTKKLKKELSQLKIQKNDLFIRKTHLDTLQDHINKLETKMNNWVVFLITENKFINSKYVNNNKFREQLKNFEKIIQYKLINDTKKKPISNNIIQYNERRFQIALRNKTMFFFQLHLNLIKKQSFL